MPTDSINYILTLLQDKYSSELSDSNCTFIANYKYCMQATACKK